MEFVQTLNNPIGLSLSPSPLVLHAPIQYSSLGTGVVIHSSSMQVVGWEGSVPGDGWSSASLPKSPRSVIGVLDGVESSWFFVDETSETREKLENVEGLVTFDCSLIAVECSS